jgi:hypothetical protein
LTDKAKSTYFGHKKARFVRAFSGANPYLQLRVAVSFGMLEYGMRKTVSASTEAPIDSSSRLSFATSPKVFSMPFAPGAASFLSTSARSFSCVFVIIVS